MELRDFINRHRGDTAWLFGKGPSFDTFDMDTAGPLRVAINDVIAHVPECLYGFANDGVRNWSEAYSPGQILFQPARCLWEYDSTAPGAVACDVVVFKDSSDDTRLTLPRAWIADIMTIRRGTLGSALQILHIMGITTVHMIGIDGGQCHAKKHEWKTRLRHDHWRDYDAIRDSAIDTAAILNLTLLFHNNQNTSMNDGKKFLRFIRNAMVNGRPYADGEIVGFPETTWRELLVCRAAEPYEPSHVEDDEEPQLPPPPVIEKAVMSATREKAVVATAKKPATPPKRK